ncbi:MAG: hypothetical protein JNM06_13135 [Blastocatellia bacterium]|nr:hypothetical protein [Blastocatellia bacterium]
MFNSVIEPSKENLLPSVTRLKEEIRVLETQISHLEKENAQSPFWLRILRKHLRFGSIKELEWTRFKLNLKQTELLVVSS